MGPRPMMEWATILEWVKVVGAHWRSDPHQSLLEPVKAHRALFLCRSTTKRHPEVLTLRSQGQKLKMPDWWCSCMKEASKVPRNAQRRPMGLDRHPPGPTAPELPLGFGGRRQAADIGPPHNKKTIGKTIGTNLGGCSSPSRHIEHFSCAGVLQNDILRS